ncbi:unnamed protein product, partial [Lampetra fluviatilis]
SSIGKVSATAMQMHCRDCRQRTSVHVFQLPGDQSFSVEVLASAAQLHSPAVVPVAPSLCGT